MVDNGVFDYEGYVRNALAAEAPGYPQIPCVFPDWDNSPRRKQGCNDFFNSTPETYERWLREVVNRRKARIGCSEPGDNRTIFAVHQCLERMG